MTDDKNRRRTEPFGLIRLEPEELEELFKVEDPEFPDRPKHDDFLMLAKLTVKLDNYCDDHGQKGLVEAVRDVVDGESVEYVADQRALRWKTMIEKKPWLGFKLLSWMWREAFIIGVGLERARRAREEAQDEDV